MITPLGKVPEVELLSQSVYTFLDFSRYCQVTLQKGCALFLPSVDENTISLQVFFKIFYVNKGKYVYYNFAYGNVF